MVRGVCNFIFCRRNKKSNSERCDALFMRFALMSHMRIFSTCLPLHARSLGAEQIERAKGRKGNRTVVCESNKRNSVWSRNSGAICVRVLCERRDLADSEGERESRKRRPWKKTYGERRKVDAPSPFPLLSFLLPPLLFLFFPNHLLAPSNAASCENENPGVPLHAWYNL